MKKILFTCLILISICLVTGCGQKIEYIDNVEQNKLDNYTYKFVGESDHFYFQTGKVYYKGDDRGLFIGNFKVKDNVEDGVLYDIVLYFNDVMLFGSVEYDYDMIPDNKDLMNKTDFENTKISEYGTLNKNAQGEFVGESDSFMETTEKTFKDSIKLIGKYCKDGECETEEFKITYVR